jgi:hypothetical protein
VTEPTIPELVDLVRQSLAEDERIALAVSTGPNKPEVWTAVERHYSDIRRWHVDGQPSNVASGMFEPDSRHIARHDPRRVLAEVASKRALLDEVLGWKHDPSCVHLHGNGLSCDCNLDLRVQAVLTLLTQPYQEANHG